MTEKKNSKTVYVDINVNRDSFVSRIIGANNLHDFSDIKLFRNLLANEKARILYVLKNKQPKSIYELAKILKRDFKSVREDLIILERFGFIEFIIEKKGKRRSMMPSLKIDQLKVEINV